MGDPTFVLSVPKIISQDALVFEMARLGDIDGLKLAFSKRWASPLVVTEHGETLIQETIHNGFPSATRFLMHMGADPEIPNDTGVLPAQEAWDYVLRKGFEPVILEQYKTIFSLVKDDLEDRGFTVVHKLVLELIPTNDFATDVERYRSLVNRVDRTGRTAAHWAVLRNDGEKLRCLLGQGADPHIKDSTWGNTLLDYSVRCSSAELTKILLDFGADVNTRTTCKWTPLYGCATYRKSKVAEAHVANARLLVAHNADIDARDEDGVDALMKAARQEIPLLAAYLVDEAGIPTTNKDHAGLTALAYAVRRQSHGTLEVLLDRGTDYTLTDNKNNSILHAAAQEGDLETLIVLSRYNLNAVDPDAKNSGGRTPAQVASEREDLPANFMPAFTKLLLGIRAGRQKQSASDLENINQRTTSLRISELRGGSDYDSSDARSSDEIFEDTLETLS